MNKGSTVSQQGDTQKIETDQWVPFLAAFTRENRGAHGRLDVLGEGAGYQVETEDRPFDGITADVKDQERTVWIHFGATPGEHLTHGAHSASAIWIAQSTEDSGAGDRNRIRGWDQNHSGIEQAGSICPSAARAIAAPAYFCHAMKFTSSGNQNAIPRR
jgi:hypothetical protein